MDQKAKVFQKVSEALKLDGEKQYEVAYRKYLESVNSLSAYLLEDLSKNGVPQGEGKTRDTKKIFSLSKECLGRMEVLLEKLCTDSQSDTLDDQKLCDSNVEKPKFGIQTLFTEGSSGSIDKACGHESEAFTSVSGVQNSATFQLESHEMSGFVLPTTWPRKKMTPLEKSQKENLLLRKVFQSRMARAADSRTKVNLHLELERRLAENMMVARRKQIMFLKDQERKEKKALARATKKLPSEEEKKQQLYAKILRIEETEDWPSNLWKKLEEAPEDSDVIEQIAMTILRTSSHPLSQWVEKTVLHLQDKINVLLNRAPFSVNGVSDPENSSLSNDSLPDSIVLLHDVDLSCSTTDTYLNKNRKHSSQSIESCIDKKPCTYKNLKIPKNDLVTCSEELPEKILFTTGALHQDTEETNIACRHIVSSTHLETKNVNDQCKMTDRRYSNEKLLPSEFLSSSNKSSTFVQETYSALQRHVDCIVSDVNVATETVLQMLGLMHEQLNTEIAQDICYKAVEVCLLQPLWPFLLALHRLAYSEAEQRIARSISQQKENCPEDMGIPSSFFEKNLTFYQEIILKIVKIIDIKSPLSKLQLLVTVIQQICGTTDFSKDCHSSLIQPLSADELLPVVSYILIKTDLPQLFSECQLLDQLMDQRIPHLFEAFLFLIFVQKTSKR
ncbi:VPS9 domain-containing protein 1-like isoform X2 [Tachypleus tridentatus]|uniref:VPS9 domain-containing protein 1-like isoform X2 n=2 Tax=Tachypleus tridentatus TaxID=6853 RepID=UPI003FD50057